MKCRAWQDLSFKLKIIIMTALVQKLWPQTHFHEIVENIMHPQMELLQIAQDILASEEWPVKIWRCFVQQEQSYGSKY